MTAEPRFCLPALPRTSPCLAPRSHKSSHQPFLYLLFIPLFLPLLIQPSRCPGGLMRSYSNHNSCAHRHRHTHGRCKSRLSNPFPAKSSSLPPGPPPPHSGSADTCYDRGWKPRDYLPESFPYEHVQIMPLSLLGCWGRLFVFGGEEAAGGCGGGESLSTQTGPSRGSPATWETAAAAPAHSRHFAPNFTTGGELSCRSPFPPPGSPRSCVQPPPVTLPRLNETLPSFIYLSAASLQHPPPPPLPLLPMWMMESARTETH